MRTTQVRRSKQRGSARSKAKSSKRRQIGGSPEAARGRGQRVGLVWRRAVRWIQDFVSQSVAGRRG